jgi:hypothetical protein
MLFQFRFLSQGRRKWALLTDYHERWSKHESHTSNTSAPLSALLRQKSTIRRTSRETRKWHVIERRRDSLMQRWSLWHQSIGNMRIRVLHKQIDSWIRQYFSELYEWRFTWHLILELWLPIHYLVIHLYRTSITPLWDFILYIKHIHMSELFVSFCTFWSSSHAILSLRQILKRSADDEDDDVVSFPAEEIKLKNKNASVWRVLVPSLTAFAWSMMPAFSFAS